MVDVGRRAVQVLPAACCTCPRVNRACCSGARPTPATCSGNRLAFFATGCSKFLKIVPRKNNKKKKREEEGEEEEEDGPWCGGRVDVASGKLQSKRIASGAHLRHGRQHLVLQFA